MLTVATFELPLFIILPLAQRPGNTGKGLMAGLKMYR